MDTAPFILEYGNNGLLSLKHPDDPFSMNWVAGEKPWGTVSVPENFSVTVQREAESRGTLREIYAITNTGAYPHFTCLGDIGIYTPFSGSCHSHIWCGGTSSYVMCLSMMSLGMGDANRHGEDQGRHNVHDTHAPNLGLVLVKGSLGAYRIERKADPSGNNRGNCILHPEPMEFEPGETKVLEWELFWHQGKDDFYRQLCNYPSFVGITADRFVSFRGEKSGLCLVPRGGKESLEFVPDKIKSLIPGESIFSVKEDKIETWCRTLELPPLMEIAAARCAFIAEKQQYCKLGSALDGAYLTYDNEEEHLVYTRQNDTSAEPKGRDAPPNGYIGRERIGMGLLMARYLRLCPESQGGTLTESLKKFLVFVLREIYNPKTGMVYDDIMRSDGCIRLCNFPWFALFFIELHCLWNDNAYLRYAYRTLKTFYERGGDRYYAISLPVVQTLKSLEKAQMRKEYAYLKECFTRHANSILSNNLNYPECENGHEQIIAAAEILLQAYLAFGDEKYLVGGEKHIEILSLFSCRQPDSSLYEVPIRHWGGFQHGKRRLHGNAFPRSPCSGMAYTWLYSAGGGEAARYAAEAGIRGALGEFYPDVSAWALYLALRFFNDLS